MLGVEDSKAAFTVAMERGIIPRRAVADALAPERADTHPMGRHRHRIPDRIVFDKLVQVVVFGCGYERFPTRPARRARWTQ